MRLSTSALVLAALVLAGCAGPEDAAEPADAGVPSAIAGEVVEVPFNDTLPTPTFGFDVSFGAAGCHAGHVWFNVNRGLLQPSLPEPFQAAEASLAVGPLGAGRGLAAIESIHCASTALGEGSLDYAVFAVLIEPPEESKALGPADTEWYQVALFTKDPRLHALLATTGARLVEGEASHRVLSIPNGPSTGDGQAQDETGPVFTFQALTSLAKRQVTFTKRVWSATDDGLLTIDYRVKSDLVQGTARCELRTGTLVQEVVKSTSCAPNDTFYGWVWNDTAWDGRLVHAVAA